MLALACPTRADDPRRVFLAFRPDDQYKPTADRPCRDESFLFVGMRFIKDLKVVKPCRKECRRLLEGNAMLSLIREILTFIPADLHDRKCTPWEHSVNG